MQYVKVKPVLFCVSRIAFRSAEPWVVVPFGNVVAVLLLNVLQCFMWKKAAGLTCCSQDPAAAQLSSTKVHE